MRTNLKAAFWISFLSLLVVPQIFPRLRLFFFAPYLVVALYKYSRFQTCWRAAGCGLILDTLSSTLHFGLTPLNYTVTILLLSSQKQNFFEDKLSTLPMMTALFSSLSTLLALVIGLCFGHHLQISWGWCVSDLVGMPLLDGLYALLFFSLPFQITYRLHRLWKYGRIS